jgi:hypothetical protein
MRARDRQKRSGQIEVVEMKTQTGPQGQNCKTCRFRAVTQLPPPSIQKAEVCRKGPPMPMLMPVPGGMMPGFVFPNLTDWCYGYEMGYEGEAGATDPATQEAANADLLSNT